MAVDGLVVDQAPRPPAKADRGQNSCTFYLVFAPAVSFSWLPLASARQPPSRLSALVMSGSCPVDRSCAVSGM